jgi:AraC family transcriptional regulator
MDWIERLNKALNYIEENLTDHLDIRDIAGAANTSHFHFQRMFAVITDLTVAEYIRRRRLTLAAKEIQQGKEILETAVKYCYESQASFTRAFSKLHGFTPGKAREPGVKLRAYPPLTFNISIQGVHGMEYEIRDMGKFEIAGIVRKMTSVDGQNLKEIPRFWQKIDENEDFLRLKKENNKNGTLKGSFVGACMDFEKEEAEEFNYMIGLEPDEKTNLSGLEKRVIPPLTWAVFPGTGKMPDAIQKVWKRIFSEWFPATEYVHAEGPELEIYLPMEENSDEIPFEVWIPIVKKN